MAVKKTAKMLALENTQGKDIQAVLKESYKKYGLNRSAVDLGVTPQTLIRWYMLFRLGSVTQRTLEENKDA